MTDDEIVEAVARWPMHGEDRALAAPPAPERHVDGRWCADLRCGKCYSADFRFKHAPPAVSVPREPTKAMVDAATVVFIREQQQKIPKWTPEIGARFWRAMYDAAQNDQSGEADPEPNVTMPTGRPDCFPPDPTAAPAQGEPQPVAWHLPIMGGYTHVVFGKRQDDALPWTPLYSADAAAALRREREDLAWMIRNNNFLQEKVGELRADRDRLAAEVDVFRACMNLAQHNAEKAEAECADWKSKYGDANEWGLRNTAAWKERAEKAEAECERLRVDSERYRWLRERYVAQTGLRAYMDGAP